MPMAASWVMPAIFGATALKGMYDDKRGKDVLKAGQKRTQQYMHPGLMPGAKKPITYKTPGGNFSYQGGNVKAKGSPFRKYLKRDYDETRGMMSRTRDLGRSVAPGMSQVRSARQNAVQNAMTKRRSNLQAQMGRRNLGGSLWDVQGRNMLAADESQLMGEAGAQSFMDEYDMSMKNIAQEAQLGQQATAQIAKGLEYDNNFMQLVFKGTRDLQDYTANMNQIMSGNATAMAELRSAQAQGMGSLAGVALGKDWK